MKSGAAPAPVATFRVPSGGPKIISHPLKNIGIVFNPNAGGLKGTRRSRLDRAVEILRNAGRVVELYPTQAPGQAAELARKAADDGCNLVLAAGGDGTINEAVNGIAGSDVAFGALPAGTANVLACEVGLPVRPDYAARYLLDGVPTRVSLGLMETPAQPPRYFVLMAGIGLDARIVRELDPDLKRRVGKLAYWHAGVRQLGRSVERFRVHVDGRELESSFTLVTRVRNYGGDFELARKIRITDPDFEVVVFERHAWHDYLRVLGAVVTNTLYRTPGITVCRATEIRIQPLPGQAVYMQADGEELGAIPVTISAVPNALTLLLPKRYAGR